MNHQVFIHGMKTRKAVEDNAKKQKEAENEPKKEQKKENKELRK